MPDQSGPVLRDPATLDTAETETLLMRGELTLTGRIVDASNASFLGSVTYDGVTLDCIYKPVRGERPLWDFPSGTLAARERAAYVVSVLGGWHVVPLTVLRDGRFGSGMVQRWVDVDPEAVFLDIVAPGEVEDGWVVVLEAEDNEGNDVVLVHPDDARLRSLAVYDAVVNNADRKGGHLLPDIAGRLLGCDHGVTFHHEPKLRTVLWGWAEQPLRDADVEALEVLRAALVAPGSNATDALSGLLDAVEIAALIGRVDELLRLRRMPSPGGRWPAIPWPAW